MRMNMGEWEIFGRCIKCGGVIHINNETGEIDRSDCICDHIGRCGYPAIRSECGNAVGDEGCLGDPELQHPECPAALHKEARE